MLKQKTKILRRLMIVSDLGIVTIAFFISHFISNSITSIEYLNFYIWILPVLLFVWSFLLYYFGMYRSFRVKRIPDVLLIIFKTCIVSFILFGSFMYIFKITSVSRIFIGLIFIISAVIMSIEKSILICFMQNIRRSGFNYRNILIVGTGKRAQRFIDFIRKHEQWGMRVLGLIDNDLTKKGQIVHGHKVLGCFQDVPAIIHDHTIDEVFFVVPRSWLSKIEPLMNILEIEGVPIRIAADFFDLKLARMKQEELSGMPLLIFESAPDKFGQLLVKRAVDIVLSGLGLIILLPLIALTALAIKITSGSPVFYKQKRCGLNGRGFILYKFRTMNVGAENQLESLRQLNEMSGPTFKLSNDPRITKVGKFLRKFSIDELPQLWNVFKGDMSLVGPRPPIPSEVSNYDSWHRRRLSMRPGITCLWQVSGRNKITDFDDWMKLDLKYIDTWSLLLDTQILLKTFPVVIAGDGAK
ncbi:MAG: sugar transferase [Candidatus Omnitrophica bacterium]|nr:sugar transferase [Candidatus Omnitrophota bacterium]